MLGVTARELRADTQLFNVCDERIAAAEVGAFRSAGYRAIPSEPST